MRGWLCPLVALAVAAVGAASDQHVFEQYSAPGLKPIRGLLDETKSTGNLIFWSVSSLLQHWPNTRHLNGHTIAAAAVLPGTVLYHGRTDKGPPMALDWLATDPEYSFTYCRHRCYLYTYVTTRPLRLAYFDGSSASNATAFGAMDSQEIVLWGNVPPDRTRNDGARILELCKWGEQFKLDGFVRIGMNFEIMTCDFNAGMKLVSESEIIPRFYFKNPAWLPFPDPEVPPGWKGSVRSDMSSAFEAINAGMWHNRPPGETRVKIDYSRVISFFDPALSSLVEARAGKSRDQFRLNQISETDSKYIRDQVADIFTREGHGSGIDWESIAQVIVDRYGRRLELLRHILQNPESNRNATEQVAEARSQVLIMLTPYMLVSAIPPDPTGPVDRSWVDPIVKHCASTHTAWAPEALLTPQERVIKGAVEEVLFRICSVLGDIWVDAFGSEEADVEELEEFLVQWESDISGLMDWLDWSIWLRCDPGCGPEEVCYIHTCPWDCPTNGGKEGTDVTPRCVKAVEPYDFFDPSTLSRGPSRGNRSYHSTNHVD